MNRTAYLLLRISTRTGRVRHAQVTSEWPVTEIGGDRGTWALLTQAPGRDFQSAHDNLLRSLRIGHPWVLPLLRPQVLYRQVVAQASS